MPKTLSGNRGRGFGKLPTSYLAQPQSSPALLRSSPKRFRLSDENDMLRAV